MKLTLEFDTALPLSPGDRALLMLIAGEKPREPVQQAAAPTPDPVLAAWDPEPCARAWMEGFTQHGDTASCEARLMVATEKCKGLLPFPLDVPAHVVRQTVEGIYFGSDLELPAAAWRIVTELAGLARQASTRRPPAREVARNAAVPPGSSPGTTTIPAPFVS